MVPASGLSPCFAFRGQKVQVLEISLQHDEKAPPVSGAEPDFIFIRLPVLREYLEKELQMVNLPFEQDFEVSVHCSVPLQTS